MIHLLSVIIYSFVGKKSLKGNLFGHVVSSVNALVLSALIVYMLEQSHVFAVRRQYFDDYYYVWSGLIVLQWIYFAFYFRKSKQL